MMLLGGIVFALGFVLFISKPEPRPDIPVEAGKVAVVPREGEIRIRHQRKTKMSGEVEDWWFTEQYVTIGGTWMPTRAAESLEEACAYKKRMDDIRSDAVSTMDEIVECPAK